MTHLPASIVDSLKAAYSAFSEGNHQGAVSIMRRLAEEGVAEAQHFTGWCYEQGVCVEKNAGEAFRWWSLAANQGFRESQNAVGTYLERGEVVSRDLVLAYVWHRRAALKGLDRASESVARLESELSQSDWHKINDVFRDEEMPKLKNT